VSGPVASGTTFDVAVAGQGAGMTLSSGTEVTARAAVPATGVGAVILNLTLTEPTGGGFATVFPSGTAWPGTSNVNVVGGQTAANLTIVPLGANGAASVYVQAAPPPPPPPAGPPIPPGLEFAPSKRGDRGPHVKSLQTYLTFSSFWMGTPEGSYGQLTQQAVMAFQKYVGLPASGTADARTVQTLVDFHRSGQWPQARSTSGNLIEVDKTKQLLFVIRNGRVLLTINTSTGTEQSYREWSDLLQTWITGFSHTYEGVLRVYREAATGWTEGELGQIYRPKYIKGGVAIHGSSSIPNYPASHGCIRVTTAFMDTVWDYNLAPMGSTVWVYR
jgi:lipoprotein-anchoring transpeptidase ErfK/SrfK